MKLIIDIDKNSRERLFDIANNGLNVPMGLENIMIMAIVNGTPISDNATNKDTFLNVFGLEGWKQLIKYRNSASVEEMNKWLNAPYQKEGK